MTPRPLARQPTSSGSALHRGHLMVVGKPEIVTQLRVTCLAADARLRLA